MLPLGFGILASIHLPHGVSYGNAFFDTEPHFPCFALFLDSSNSLILKQKVTITEVAKPQSRWFRFSKKFRMLKGKGLKGKEVARNEMPAPMQEFVRIGIANFLRTEEQRKMTRGIHTWPGLPYGPITAQNERTVVTIY
jgi:hypothetical protein